MYAAPEEQALGSIFDIGDVQRQEERTPVVYSLPANPSTARILTSQVVSINSGEAVDSTAAVGLMDATGISVGDRIGFVTATGSASETNGPQGYNVDSVNTSTNVIEISDIDGDDIPTLVRENIGSTTAVKRSLSSYLYDLVEFLKLFRTARSSHITLRLWSGLSLIHI